MVAIPVAGTVERDPPRPRTRLVALAAFVRRSRVVHFVALGSVIFAVARDPDRDRVIRVAGAARPQQIEDEVLVREAHRLGLDQDDPIVRRRLVQKVLFLAEDLGGASRTPDDAALRAFFASRADRYAAAARARFVHVFAHTRDEAAALRPAVLAWSAAHPGDAPPDLGDAFPISRSVSRAVADLDATFGPDLRRAVETTPVGTWSLPVQSKFGWHLVRVIERTAARPSRFEDVRSAVLLDYLIDKREDAVAAFEARAMARYRIFVGGKRVTDLPPERRTARHALGSGEDE